MTWMQLLTSSIQMTRGLGKKTIELQNLRHRVRQLELENKALRKVAMSSEDTRNQALAEAAAWLQTSRPKQVKAYSLEFKRAVLARAAEIGVAPTLRESGISAGAFYNWRKELGTPMSDHTSDKTLE